MKKNVLVFLLISLSINTIAQKIAPAAWQKFPDSAVVKVHPSYNKVNSFHKIFS